MNYETIASGNAIGHVCIYCHGNKEVNFSGVSRKFKFYRGRYVRVASPEKLLKKENANIKQLADGEGKILTTAAGNILPLDKSYRHPSAISLQRNVKRSKAHPFTNVMHHILSRCQNCNLCKDDCYRSYP